MSIRVGEGDPVGGGNRGFMSRREVSNDLAMVLADVVRRIWVARAADWLEASDDACHADWWDVMDSCRGVGSEGWWGYKWRVE